MLNTAVRSSWIIGGWIAAVAGIVGVSIAQSANASTLAFLLALGVSPAIVVVLLARGAPSPSVAEILHSVEKTGGRS